MEETIRSTIFGRKQAQESISTRGVRRSCAKGGGRSAHCHICTALPPEHMISGKEDLANDFGMWTLHHWAGDRGPRLDEGRRVRDRHCSICHSLALLAFLRRVDKSLGVRLQTAVIGGTFHHLFSDGWVVARTISTPWRKVSHPLQSPPDSGGGVRDRGKHRLS